MHTGKYDLHTLEDSEHICEKCLNWKDFKEKCWYHWQLKKECSQQMDLPQQEDS